MTLAATVSSTTLREPAAAIEGPGLFTGRAMRLTLRRWSASDQEAPHQEGPDQPAPDPSGRERPIQNMITVAGVPLELGRLDPEPVVAAFASLPPRHTNLRDQHVRIATVEHLAGAIALAGVSGVCADVEAADGAGGGLLEIPILDGSALAFYDAIAGSMAPTPEPVRRPPKIIPREPFVVGDPAGAHVLVEPPDHDDQLLMRYELDYGPGAPIAAHAAEIDLIAAGAAERRRIASARTFCLSSEARQMQALGLFGGLGPRDLLVIEDDRGSHAFGGPVDNAYGFDGEPAAHKLLDLIGDLMLVARPLRAKVTARRSGHALNHETSRRLVGLG